MNIYTPERGKDESRETYIVRRILSKYLADGITSGYFYRNGKVVFPRLPIKKQQFISEFLK